MNNFINFEIGQIIQCFANIKTKIVMNKDI